MMPKLTYTEPLILGEKERILILAPHPDDESLAAGGLITFMRQYYPDVDLRVVITTNGDASYSAAFVQGSHLPNRRNFQLLALRRQEESLTALSILGLDRSQVSFWGFPDRGLIKLKEDCWNDQEVYTSPTTGFRLSEQTINSPRLRYTGANLLRLLENELTRFEPTTIIFPHPEDAHPDHQTLGLLTLQAADTLYKEQLFPKMLAYLTWSRGSFLGLQSHTRKNANEAPKHGHTWKTFPYPQPIQKQKEYALRAYRSQRIAAGSLLKAGGRSTQEAFVQLMKDEHLQ